MTSKSEITMEISSEESNCGDGCCWSYDSYAYITMDNGEEFSVNITVDRDDAFAMILDKLGYKLNIVYVDDEVEED